MIKRFFSIIMILSACVSFVYAESQGEKLFKENKPEQAAVLLEEDINNNKADAGAYNFLGLSYFQLGRYEDSVNVFAKGLKTPGTNKKILAFNQGNSYYALGNYEEAAKSYNLAYSADSTFTKALLNRANAYLMAREYDNALNDYEKYIVLCPDDEQKDEINAVIEALKRDRLRREEEARLAALEAERQAEEEKRLAEEMARIKAEEERIAEEQRLKKEAEEAEQRRIEEEKRAIEQERRRKLLEDVANSLQQTDSTNMSAGTEDLLDYDMEAELD